VLTDMSRLLFVSCAADMLLDLLLNSNVGYFKTISSVVAITCTTIKKPVLMRFMQAAPLLPSNTSRNVKEKSIFALYETLEFHSLISLIVRGSRHRILCMYVRSDHMLRTVALNAL